MRLKFGKSEPIRELGAPTRQRFKRTRKRKYKMRHGVEPTPKLQNLGPTSCGEHPRRSAPRAGGARRAARIAGKEQLAACTYCNATARAGILYRRKECPQALFFSGPAEASPPPPKPSEGLLPSSRPPPPRPASVAHRAPRCPPLHPPTCPRPRAHACPRVPAMPSKYARILQRILQSSGGEAGASYNAS